MSFEDRFASWLNNGLTSSAPEEVIAYSFNLFEPALEQGVRFGVELIGAGSFDDEEPDWACDEVWAPSERSLLIPVEYSGTDWDACRRKVKSLLEKQLDTEGFPAKRLKQSKAVGLGFVDGDLELIWLADKP